MRQFVPISLALVALLGGGASSAQTSHVGVQDDAHLFSPEAVRQADRELDDLHRQRGWEARIHTIEALRDGETVKERALAEAKALKEHGLLILISKEDHKVWVEPSNSARRVFTHDKVEAIVKAFVDAFRDKEYDRGLRDAVAAIVKDASLATATAPARSEAPAKGEAPAAVPAPGDAAPPKAQRGSNLPLLIAGGVGVLVLLWLLSRARGGSQQSYPAASQPQPQPQPQGGYAPAPQGGYPAAGPAPGPRPAPPYGGRPGYAPPPGPGYPAGGPGPGYPAGGYGAPPPQQGGGGFVSGALGGLGGAVLGNILYDKFGRPHTPEGHPLPMPPQGSEHGGAVPPVPTGGPTESPPPSETYDPDAGAGGDWGTPPDPNQAGTTEWGVGDSGDAGWTPLPDESAGGEWNQAGATGDWNVQEPAPDEPAGAEGDWGDNSAGSDADAGGDWSDSNDDQGAGGSW
jgi:uncharacterized membrane protein YgcG